MASEAEELNSFYLTLVHLNLDSYAWLVPTARDLAALQIASTDGKYGDRGFTKDTLRKKKKKKATSGLQTMSVLPRTEPVGSVFL